MRSRAAILLLLAFGYSGAGAQSSYYGREVGKLSELHHGVRGRVFAIDSRTLFVQDFHYDGEGPTAYFYVGSSKAPGPSGATRLRDERGGTGPLRRYRGEGLTLSLPDGKTLRDLKWFSVWCDEFAVNFGDVSIPRDLDYPKPVKVAALRGVHGVSSDPIVVIDAQTLLIPNFSYDGEAPDAKFWVGRGDKPSPQGIRIPDENGKEVPLRKYDKKTIVLTLPGELTVFDIGHFAVWCEAFTVNFGHVVLPRHQLSNIPPSLKMLGISPQSRNNELVKESAPSPQRKRGRRPLARLDATTYRPHLRPGAGPLAALTDPLTDHSSLHRRADSYTSPQEQLLIKQDKDQSQEQKVYQTYEKDDQQQQTPPEDYEQQNDDKQQQQKVTTLQQQANYQNEKAVQTYQTQTEQPYYQSAQKHQQQIKPVPQQMIYQPNSQQIVQPEQYQVQNENYQQQRSQELYYQVPSNYQNQPVNFQNQQVYYQQPHYTNDQLLYQQRAYHEQLLNEQYRQLQQRQYRLIPYNSPQPGRY